MSGQRSTRAPVAPAWSKWMCVSSSARGRASPSSASNVVIVDSGPGSIRTPSTSHDPITRSSPWCFTSINATAAWLIALYIVTGEDNGVDRRALQGTTQNDILKEFLSRGTYAFPPEPSMRLIADMIAFTVDEVPKWNPINICSYHLQEAGATPVQEIAYTMCNAIAVLDRVRDRVDDDTFPRG